MSVGFFFFFLLVSKKAKNFLEIGCFKKSRFLQNSLGCNRTVTNPKTERIQTFKTEFYNF